MGTFRVHHIRFFDYKPKAIHCLAYSKEIKKLALSRSDGSLEIWSENDNWYQERIIPGSGDRSVEAILWQGRRLFTAGLDGEVTEYDLVKLQPMHSAFSHAGPIWCLTQNAAGNILAAGTEQGCVVLFDIAMDNLQYLRAFDKQEGRILSIDWHGGENVIVTGGVDNIRLWSANSGHAVQRLTIGREEVRKETIVWCVAVTSDMTVISGDSRGKTCFWNGKNGILIKSFQSHKADVLSLSLHQKEDSVFTVGAEPTIVQFRKVPSGGGGDHTVGKWVRSVVCSSHTHDIRAIVSTGQTVITGGVDTNLVFHHFGGSIQQKGRKVPGMPHRSLVHMAKKAGLVMLQYPRFLEVWRLGSTNRTSSVQGEILPLDSKPLKLIQLKAKIGDCIICSAISADGSLIAYSDERSIRVYSLDVMESGVLQPRVSLTRIKQLDEDIASAHIMTFTCDNKLVTATCTAAVQVMEVKVMENTEVKDADVEKVSVQLIHTFPPQVKSPDAIHLLCASHDGVYAAVADHNCRVQVHNINTKQSCQVPAHKKQACAMVFSADSRQLCIVFCDSSVSEYVVNLASGTTTLSLSDWSRGNSDCLQQLWKRRRTIATQISPNPGNPDQYFIHDDDSFCILDRSKIVHRNVKRKQSTKTPRSALTVCSKYKHLLHLEPLSEDWLVAVEQTPVAITDSLPTTLKQKKFGT